MDATHLSDAARRHALFAELSAERVTEALAILDGRVEKYEKNEYLLLAGEAFSSFGIVLSGGVQVFMEDIDGEYLMMASVDAGDSFGESLAYLGTAESPVSIVARADAEVLWLSPARLRLMSAQGDALAFELYERLVRVLAVRALSQNDRIQILCRATIREKLRAFFTQCEHRYGGRTFTVPFDREGLATYLGVNRAALSRELSKMKEEKIIDYFRNTFRLL